MLRQKTIRFLLIAAIGIVSSLVVGVFIINTAGAGGVLLPWDTPPKYRIAYLVGTDLRAEPKLVSPSQVAQTLGARTVQNWSQVMKLDQDQALDALVVSKNSVQSASKADVTRLYERGVVISLIDVDTFKTAELLNDPCISKNDQGTRNYKGTFAVISAHLILGPPKDVALIRAAADTCGNKPVAGVKGQTQEIVGHTTKEITNVSDYNIYAQELVRYIEWVRFTKQDFANQR